MCHQVHTYRVHNLPSPREGWTVHTGTIPTGMPKSQDKQSSFYLRVLLLVLDWRGSDRGIDRRLGLGKGVYQVAGSSAFSLQLLQ